MGPDEVWNFLQEEKMPSNFCHTLAELACSLQVVTGTVSMSCIVLQISDSTYVLLLH